MNERVMQFRIGMFVIVAGLVLTMMIVWFGESPSLLRAQVYLKVRYTEAPGVLEGVPVRKSGIRIGEVMAIAFDQRENQPDGVLVTLALERQFKVRQGSIPRLTRSLIGDVAIDMQPGTGPGYIEPGRTPSDPMTPIIEGEVAPDPSKALAAATKAFERAGDTLDSIKQAGDGLARVTKSADNLDRLLTIWHTTGQNVTGAAQAIKRFIETNEGDFHPALVNLRQVAQKLDETLDPKTREALQAGLAKFSSAAGRLDAAVAELEPALKELGAPSTRTSLTTDIGQTIRRLNLIASDLLLLTSKLRNGEGGLNTEGSLQKLIVQSDLHDNLNRMALSANQALLQLKTVLAALRTFAERVSSDPASMTRGAFQR
ncbi:MAG TPA: MlaD family protein [Isosphaeraceae bacterium]|nr:MlaD family protein [Isosphaeraceae bacterium]